MSRRKYTTLGAHAHCEIAAYHEAGHAVAGVLLGLWVIEVKIDHHSPGSGLTTYRDPHSRPGSYRGPRRDAPSHWARALSSEQRKMVFALAGPLAEAKLLGKPLRTLGSIGDLEAVHQLVRWPVTEGEDQHHGAVVPGADIFFKAEIRRTRRILNQPSVWRAITLIAGDLQAWGKLKGDDVVETVQWAMGGCRQMGLFVGINVLPGPIASPPQEGLAPALASQENSSGAAMPKQREKGAPRSDLRHRSGAERRFEGREGEGRRPEIAPGQLRDSGSTHREGRSKPVILRQARLISLLSESLRGERRRSGSSRRRDCAPDKPVPLHPA